MWPFKKKTSVNPLSDATAKMIASGIVRVQLRLCSLLQRWERKLSLRQKKIVFVIFCLAGCGYCFFLLASALYGGNVRKGPVITIEKATPPPLPPAALLAPDSIKSSDKSLPAGH